MSWLKQSIPSCWTRRWRLSSELCWKVQGRFGPRNPPAGWSLCSYRIAMGEVTKLTWWLLRRVTSNLRSGQLGSRSCHQGLGWVQTHSSFSWAWKGQASGKKGSDSLLAGSRLPRGGPTPGTSVSAQTGPRGHRGPACLPLSAFPGKWKAVCKPEIGGGFMWEFTQLIS